MGEGGRGIWIIMVHTIWLFAYRGVYLVVLPGRGGDRMSHRADTTWRERGWWEHGTVSQRQQAKGFCVGYSPVVYGHPALGAGWEIGEPNGKQRNMREEENPAAVGAAYLGGQKRWVSFPASGGRK